MSFVIVKASPRSEQLIIHFVNRRASCICIKRLDWHFESLPLLSNLSVVLN